MICRQKYFWNYFYFNNISLFFLKGDESAIDGPNEEIVDDGRWRPMLLTIGLLYKLNRIHETDENCW